MNHCINQIQHMQQYISHLNIHLALYSNPMGGQIVSYFFCFFLNPPRELLYRARNILFSVFPELHLVNIGSSK